MNRLERLVLTFIFAVALVLAVSFVIMSNGIR